MAMMRIYYLGGLPNVPPGKENGVQITSGQQVFGCPPVGEFLEVPDYVGRDIMGKYGFDIFNTNGTLAEKAKRGTLSFTKHEENGRVMISEVMSDEEILRRAEEIQSQRQKLEVKAESAPKSGSEPEETEDEPSDDSENKPTARRSKKKE